MSDNTKEYSIDELSREAGMTVRNVRAYQEKGLLPPPERRGRKGVYGPMHLSRLRIIGQLLERGYTLANIGEMLEAWQKGQDLSQLLGLEAAITSPWSDEPAGYYSIGELLKLFRLSYGPASFRLLDEAVKIGVLQREGRRFRAPSPRLIQTGAELVGMGIPLSELLAVVRSVRAKVEPVTEQLVSLVLPLIDRYGGEDKVPPPEAVPELADLIWRLRPLAKLAINAEVDRAMERAVNKYFGDRLAEILEHLEERERS